MSDPYAAPQQPSVDPDEIELTKDDLTWGMLCHLLAFSGVILPLGNFIGPLVMWMMKKDESEFTDYHGKESLNFQISIFIYAILCIPLIFIIVGILGLVLPIIACIKANSGEFYRYPFTIRML